jgi:vacuolar-type H+-ATPase subunit F/Vma7
MSRIGALGETARVQGFAVAGALVFPADEQHDVSSAWDTLPADLGVLILTPAAARLLDARLDERPNLLAVVMPE